LENLNLPQFEARKKSHLEIALDPAMQTSPLSGLESVRLVHDALPEMDLSDVDLATPWKLAGKSRPLKTPLFVSGMTAGHASASLVNERLARACARRGWIFGVGSQRRELDPSRPQIDSWSNLRQIAPSLTLLGNLGLAQAKSVAPKEIEKLARNAGADAFCIHLNALQEAIQPEGTPDFAGGVAALRSLVAKAKIPIVVKETGCGFSERALAKIAGLKLAAVDVSGLGGTHWGRIEGVRAGREGRRVQARAADTFSDWGVPLADSVRAAARVLPKSTEIWASGGVRTGLDAAKLIALGATRVGFAKPALEAALASDEGLDLWMETIEFELRVALFCTGNRTPAALRGSLAKASKAAKKKGSR
jgi:isopentenyl-diphosphate delta-isomerase